MTVRRDASLPDTIAARRAPEWHDATVLIVTRGFDVQWGGAEASLLGVLDGLLAADPAISWALPDLDFGRLVSPGPLQFAKLYRHRARLRRTLGGFRGRAVLAQSLLAPAAIGSVGRSVRSFYFLRDQFSWNEWANTERGARRLLKRAHRAAMAPFWSTYERDNRLALAAAGTIVANSDFTATQTRRIVDREVAIAYPDVTLPAASLPSGEEVAMVGANADKGIDILRTLAQRFPEIRFRLYFRGPAPRGMPGNVLCLGWETDRSRIYAGLRLFLAPSQWPEAYNRSAIEAQSFGVPVLASGVGGLAANVPQHLVVEDFRSADRWAEAFDDVLGRAPGLRDEARRFGETRAAEAQSQKDALVATILKGL